MSGLAQQLTERGPGLDAGMQGEVLSMITGCLKDGGGGDPAGKIAGLLQGD